MAEDALTELLEAAHEVAGRSQPAEFEVDLADFLPRFYEDVAPDDLIGKDPIDVVGPATHMLRLAAVRPQGTAVVDVFTPTVAANEWTCGHTVVEVITDDMPFLLDSVVAAITQAGRSLHMVAHPIYSVRRDVAGGLQAVLPNPVDESAPDVIRESWIHLEIDLDSDPARHEELKSILLKVLRDVREAVEDWQRMTAQALALADELRASPPPSVPDGYAEEAAEFLQWLAEGNYTFLGYRMYDLVRDPDPTRAGQSARHRSGAAALGPGPVAVLLRDAAGGPGSCRRTAGAGSDQGQLPLHSPPAGPLGLRRGQAVRRRWPGHR